MYPVIVCIAKKEGDYIEEWVKYHLALGFKYIYLYDNEDIPTYESMLDKYKDNIKVIHIPFNNYDKAIQAIILDDFVDTYLFTGEITHVAHIDIDEFIVLKKHENICDFIDEYIVGDCQGIGMNWRFFGCSGLTEKSNEPVTVRFTMCGKNGNNHIKTLFKAENFVKFNTCHDVTFSTGYTKGTNNTITHDHFINDIDLDVIQLNHYKVKTLPEFRYIRTRGGAHICGIQPIEDVDRNFNTYNQNDVEDLYAYNFYTKMVLEM